MKTINQLLDIILCTDQRLLDPAMYRTINNLKRLKQHNPKGGLLKVGNTAEILNRLHLLKHPEAIKPTSDISSNYILISQ